VNRKTLESQFLSQGSSPWKTFVLEAHSDGEPHDFLADVFGATHIEETDDRFLFQLSTPELDITVDTLEDRFWSFHTINSAAESQSLLRAAVARRRDLDFVWLPSAHLRLIQRGIPPNWIKTDFRGRMILSLNEVQELSLTVRGRAAEDLLDLISGTSEFPYAVSLSQLGVDVTDPDLGSVVEAVNRRALFVAKGDSFALHQHVIQTAVRRYRALVEAAENIAMSIDPIESSGEDGGGRPSGGPIELSFSRPLVDLDLFLDGLFSSREPFRLWGAVNDAFEDYAEVEAVDLHVGQRLRIEVSRTMIRVHLRKGGCGNTVARLVSNLQHHVDGGIVATDESIQRHLLPLSSTPPAA
jgi:hypothetical protein